MKTFILILRCNFTFCLELDLVGYFLELNWKSFRGIGCKISLRNKTKIQKLSMKSDQLYVQE